MKPGAVLLCATLAAASALPAQSPAGAKVAATTTLHNDGTRTESVKDLFKHELSETTYDARGVVIAKKKFLLGPNGDPTQGAVYDGADNVIARVQFFFDDLGRVIEERMSNTQGEVFQRVIRQYDLAGRPLSPQVINLPVKAPNMRPATLDFTQSPRIAPGRPGKRAAAGDPGQGPRVETVTPQTGAIASGPAPGGEVPPSFRVPGAAEAPKEDSKKRSKLNPLNWFRKEK